MTSQKQIKANRLNGLKGGVKTAQGKAISSRNAVTHGIFSSDALLIGEDGLLLAQLREQLIEEYQPQGEMETILVECIISSTWRLKRALRSEKTYSHPRAELLGRNDFVAGGDYRFSAWQNYQRYEVAIKNELYKAMHELERLQKARRANSEDSTDD